MITKNKRGDLSDIFVFIIIITFLAISFIAVLLVNTELRDAIATTALNESSSASTIIDAFDNINNYTVQRGYVIFVGILIIGMLVSSFLVRVHPAFLFLYIIMLGFGILISVYLANLYSMFIESGQLATIAANQPMITFWMEHMVKVVLAVGALSMIIALSKIFTSPGGENPI